MEAQVQHSIVLPVALIIHTVALMIQQVRANRTNQGKSVPTKPFCNTVQVLQFYSNTKSVLSFQSHMQYLYGADVSYKSA